MSLSDTLQASVNLPATPTQPVAPDFPKADRIVDL
jgi:hypothetical protein